MIGDALRLSVGTLSAVPVPPPRRVDRRIAGLAMLFAPAAVVPLAVLAAGIGWVTALWSSPVVAAILAIGVLALGTRAMHWDGLADTADALTASYDADRSLEVLKSGVSGPAGVITIVLVGAAQIAGATALFAHGWRGTVALGVVVCASRLVVPLTAARGIRPARDAGLGATFAESTAPWVVVASWVIGLAALAGAVVLAGGDWWRGVVAGAAALAVVGVVLVRSIRRMTGVTGDTFGAAIELSFAVLLISLT